MSEPSIIRKTIFRVIEPSYDKSKVGIFYDFAMIVVIVASIVPLAFKEQYPVFDWIDRIAVTIFIVDYILRLVTAGLAFPKLGKKAFAAYPFTPFAIIDLLSILPSLPFVHDGFRLFRILRLLRTLRVFRVFKLFRYSKSINRVLNVLKSQKAPLLAVCWFAFGYILVSALVMFSVEPETFESFFEAIYWATISLTTVGYGDIHPLSTLGQAVTMISSVIGVAVVALPAGIITAGYLEEVRSEKS